MIDGRIEKAKASRETARKAKENTSEKNKKKTAQQELDLQKIDGRKYFSQGRTVRTPRETAADICSETSGSV